MGAGGRGGGVEVFCADDVEACGGGAGCGDREGEAAEGGHDEGWGGGVVLWGAEKETDLRTINAFCTGGGGLGEDGVGCDEGLEVGDGAEFEGEAADADGCGALGLADEVGDGDFLWA